MNVIIKYSKSRHGRARLGADGSLILSIPVGLKNNKSFEQELLAKGRQLVEKKAKREENRIEAIGIDSMKLWGEDVVIQDISYLKGEFMKKIEPLIEFHCRQLNVKYGKVSAKYLKSKWGSCSYRDNLSFNLKLVHLDPIFTYYVVVHEVCHIVHKNHSKKFRDLVAKYFPDYKEIRRALRRVVI